MEDDRDLHIQEELWDHPRQPPQAKRIIDLTVELYFNAETIYPLVNILQNCLYLSYFAKTSAIAQFSQVTHWRRQDKLGVRALLELKQIGKNSFYARTSFGLLVL